MEIFTIIDEMLNELNVRSYGIIKSLSWHPDKGFNVITGETGAGKSMVLDAFEALLDGKITENEIRTGDDACRIEADIVLGDERLKEKTRSILEDKGINYEDESVLMTCELRTGGRTVSRVNGEIAQRTVLNDLHSVLVDIHGQKQHLSLYDKKNHMAYLDDYGDLNEIKSEVTSRFREYSALKRKIESIRSDSKSASDNRDLLTYQIKEIEDADLSEDEEQKLLDRKQVLTHAEQMRGYAYEIGMYLTEDENGNNAESLLGHAVTSLRKLAALDNSLDSLAEELSGITENINDIAYRISDYSDSLEFDPGELEQVEDRLAVIKAMKRKYGPEVKDVLAYLSDAKNKLGSLDSAEFDLEKLEEDLKDKAKEYLSVALVLSEKRRETAARMKESVGRELNELGMKYTAFDVKIDTEQNTDNFSENGIDDIEFMISSVPGEAPKPLASIASTGEVSRLTLAYKVALASADKTPILIFDEIDIGVGGRTGEVLGRKLWELSRHHQVICVTHLAQIACYADAHFSVSKSMQADRLDSHMERLNDKDRIDELAVMLGGEGNKNSSLTVASELVKNSEKWKKDHA